MSVCSAFEPRPWGLMMTRGLRLVNEAVKYAREPIVCTVINSFRGSGEELVSWGFLYGSLEVAVLVVENGFEDKEMQCRNQPALSEKACLWFLATVSITFIHITV